MKKFLFIVGIILAIGFIAGGVYSLQKNDDPYVAQAPPELPRPPLKALAKDRGLQIGTFASLKYLRERPYREIIASQFEYVIIDGEPNWKFEDHTLRPSVAEYDFRDMDAVFQFASENDMPVRVQHLLWGDEKWLPDWLKNGNYTNDQLNDIIKDHIATVGERYKGRVREYTVVNEAFSRALVTAGNRDWWGERLGTDYIDMAFLEARKADPKAILILNDFGNEYDSDITRLMYDYVRDAKARGIPIDAVGMQMHIDGATAKSRQEVAATMRRFAELGLKIYITEFDVNMQDVGGSTEAREQTQARIYRDMVGACLDVGPDICPNFGLLGLIDRQSWYHGIGATEASPLMFNDDYSPKAAFFALRDELER
jgi:endo-1,4-beta-xylanase